MLSYYNMVSWIISHVDISTCTIFNDAKQVVRSWRPKVLQNMYKLEPPKIYLNKEYICTFEKEVLFEEKIEPSQCLRDWVEDSITFKTRTNILYPIRMFKNPHSFVIKVLAQLYEEPNPENSKLEWVPLFH